MQCCPVCRKSDNLIRTVTRKDLVTMQNYIFPTLEEAVNSPTGQFELSVCTCCGFAFNSLFDSSLLTYDKNYDNSVPSAIFTEYYREIASFLYNKYSLENGFVIDIGCGKGQFLKILCEMYPGVRGLGVDPSFEFSDNIPGNLVFIQDVFKEEHITQKPSLLICRHTLEHIEQPVSFLESIRRASSKYENVPFFIEVPDLEWIIENNAFWDFCYEHCNYFTSESFTNMLQGLDFEVLDVKKAFGSQYLWGYGEIKQKPLTFSNNSHFPEKIIAYAKSENISLSKIVTKLEEERINEKIIVWGMATKGVMFCNLVDPAKKLIDYCIDINDKKMGCYVPRTGHLINSSEILKVLETLKATIVVMNPNYLVEIVAMCRNFAMDAKFIDASGEVLA